MYYLTDPQPPSKEQEWEGHYDPTCLFPDDHDPGHPVNMKFRLFPYTTDDRILLLTEAEILDRLEAGERFSCSSQFDFWQEDLGVELYQCEQCFEVHTLECLFRRCCGGVNEDVSVRVQE
jgi:hypothetical protein